MTMVRYPTTASIELSNPLHDLCKAVTPDNRRALAVYIANSIEKISVRDAEAILEAINPLPIAAEDPPRAPPLNGIEQDYVRQFVSVQRGSERVTFIHNLQHADRNKARPELIALLEYLQGV